MKKTVQFLPIIFCLFGISGLNAQENSFRSSFHVRSGVEANWFDNRFSQNPINCGYVDIGFVTSPVARNWIKGNIDILYRSGVEFGQTRTYLKINEAWGGLNNGKFSFSAGKRIIKWNSNLAGSQVNIFNPRDYLFRSPREMSIDLAVIFTSISYQPTSRLLLLNYRSLLSIPLLQFHWRQWNYQILSQLLS